jgi:hypothetical protein
MSSAIRLADVSVPRCGSKDGSLLRSMQSVGMAVDAVGSYLEGTYGLKLIYQLGVYSGDF